MTSPGFEGTRTAAVNGTTLAYREQGAGDPVVFVHGSLSDLRTWDQQLPAIGRAHRAITYSRRYARPNDDIDPETDDQMVAHVDDLVAFLRSINAAPAHLVGNSWGAFISLLTAMRHPELVRTLVLEEPPVATLLAKSVPPSPGDVLRLLATQPRTAMTFLKTVVAMFGPVERAFKRGDDERAMQIFGLGILGRDAFEELPKAREQQMRENIRSFRAQILGAGLPPLDDDDARSLRVPAMLVTGVHTPAVLIRLTDRLEELLPVVERVEIPNASHLMHEDNASAVNEQIVRFIGRHRDGPAA